mmetsp:Transcript_125002/g.176409  ORF Transcript_125002/g.176409 Transcript_125002/m.176409 type:complete len:174 (+) Transcript_125002:64-585(+)|eukprot:s4550_g6.t1
MVNTKTRLACALALALVVLRSPAFVSPAVQTRRQVLTAAVGLPVAVFQAESAFATAACDAADLEKYSKLKVQWDSAMKTFLLDDPPGGTWEDRCIRRFGSAQFPKDAGEKCIAERVSQAAGLSPGCSACWGALTQCTYDNCASQCLDAKSSPCRQCISNTCAVSFESCSGIKL